MMFTASQHTLCNLRKIQSDTPEYHPEYPSVSKALKASSQGQQHFGNGIKIKSKYE